VGEDSRSRGVKCVLLRYGVSPVDRAADSVSRPGSENRTRFLDLEGVFAGGRDATPVSLAGSSTFMYTGLARPVLIRLLRRTARGLSSVRSTTSCWGIS